MKKATISVQFDQEKLKALQFYTGKLGTTLYKELDGFLEKLYKKNVPVQIREYIESMANPDEAPHTRPNRPTSQPTGDGRTEVG